MYTMGLRNPYSREDLDCRDPAYKGPEGAKKILALMNGNHRVLNISSTSLGTTGFVALLKGVETLRIRESQKWRYKEPQRGLETIRALHADVADAGLEKIVGYAAKCSLLLSLDLGYNRIELKYLSLAQAHHQRLGCATLASVWGVCYAYKYHVPSIVASINSSALIYLALSGNHLSPDALSRFLAGLDAPRLATLILDDCNFGRATSTGIAAFIRSPNSRHLHHFSLNGNAFGHLATVALINSLEEDNFTLGRLDLRPAFWPSGKIAKKAKFPGDAFDQPWDREDLTEPKDLQLQDELQRIPSLCARNKALTLRVRKAALRYLPTARVLLNARSLPLPAPSPGLAPRSVCGFADLPAELVYSILRDSSRDPEAFSTAQFARLIEEAEGAAGLRKAMAARRTARPDWFGEWEVGSQMKTRLLAEGGWTGWERVREG